MVENGVNARSDRSFYCTHQRTIDLIYTAYRPVTYSPSSHSALAEAELVYSEDHLSISVYISFTLNAINDVLRQYVHNGEKVEVLTWTTTPWTLAANMVPSSSLSCY
jgi:isoleucyl-tRNA synthetase